MQKILIENVVIGFADKCDSKKAKVIILVYVEYSIEKKKPSLAMFAIKRVIDVKGQVHRISSIWSFGANDHLQFFRWLGETLSLIFEWKYSE